MAKLRETGTKKRITVEVSEKLANTIAHQKERMKSLGIVVEYEFDKAMEREVAQVEKLIASKENPEAAPAPKKAKKKAD